MKAAVRDELQERPALDDVRATYESVRFVAESPERLRCSRPLHFSRKPGCGEEAFLLNVFLRTPNRTLRTANKSVPFCFDALARDVLRELQRPYAHRVAVDTNIDENCIGDGVEVGEMVIDRF